MTNTPEPRTAYLERIDDTHANPHRAWVEMGEPAYLSVVEVEQLKAVSRVVKAPVGWTYEGRTLHLDVDLPPHSVAAVTMEFPAEPLHPEPAWL